MTDRWDQIPEGMRDEIVEFMHGRLIVADLRARWQSQRIRDMDGSGIREVPAVKMELEYCRRDLESQIAYAHQVRATLKILGVDNAHEVTPADMRDAVLKRLAEYRASGPIDDSYIGEEMVEVETGRVVSRMVLR